MKLTKRDIIIAVSGLIAGLLIFFIANRILSSTDHDHEQTEVHDHDKTEVWTCSMHPQIRREEHGNCPICGMELITVDQADETGSFEGPFFSRLSPGAAALANIQTVKIGKSSAQTGMQLTGKIAVNEQNLRFITADYSGRIDQLHVNYTGQSIQRGQKLATIYSPDLLTAQRELQEAAKTKDINPVLYQAVREKLRLWKLSDSQIDAIERKEETLTSFDIYADISGVVINRNVSAGDYINTGNVLLEIADLSSVWVLMDAYEDDISFIQTGDKVEITVRSLPGQTFTSTISYVEPVVNPVTRTATVRAAIANPERRLKPEMFVNVNILSSAVESEEMLTIPQTAILWTGKKAIVYVKVKSADSPVYEMREIGLGAKTGDNYIVEWGLSAGEEIVKNGVFAIDAAAQVSGKFSMMSPPPLVTEDIPKDFIRQLDNLTTSYLKLQEAFVQTDFEKSKTAVTQLKAAFEQTDMSLLEGEMHDVWMEYYNQLTEVLDKLGAARDIEQLRILNSDLSNVMIEVQQNFGPTRELLYIAFCPMAMDDDGAFWISEIPEIYNPYFGDRMLRCGEIKERIYHLGFDGERMETQAQDGHVH